MNLIIKPKLVLTVKTGFLCGSSVHILAVLQVEKQWWLVPYVQLADPAEAFRVWKNL